MEADTSSSIYSTGSNSNPMAHYTQAGESSSSRRDSYTPSYMSNIQARPPGTPSEQSVSDAASYRFHERKPSNITLKIPRRPVSAANNASAPAQGKAADSGLLLLVYASTPHPSTRDYLETLLARRSFSGIALVGSKEHEAALKQLKMEIYALIGKLQKEVGVYTYLRDCGTESEMAVLAQEVNKANPALGLHGVICSPEFDASDTAGLDVMSMDEASLQGAWKRGVGFVHAVSHTTIPLLKARAAASTAATSSAMLLETGSPFFLVAGTPASTAAAQITISACDTLVSLVERQMLSRGVAVGYADALLVPEQNQSRNDEPTPQPKDNKSRTITSSLEAYDEAGLIASESPTRLWNIWAIQNDD